MSGSTRPETGAVVWHDLTIDDADTVRDFYRRVVGWQAEEVDMGGYCDYNMTGPRSGTPQAGVCHRRGANADLPAAWLIYISVEDLDVSLTSCIALGGRVLSGPHGMGEQGRYAVIEDPAGAVAALFEPAGEDRS